MGDADLMHNYEHHESKIPSNVVLIKPSPLPSSHHLNIDLEKTAEFVAYSETFFDILGSSPKTTLIAEKDYAFAHEAGIYDRHTNAVYFTANYKDSRDPLKIHAVDATTLQVTDVTHKLPNIVNANGGCWYRDGLLFCAQGSFDSPSQLIHIDTRTWQQTVLVDHFDGREFNSLNDVVVHHETGDIWFTDPPYGHAQGFREKHGKPCTFRYSPAQRTTYIVEDSLIMPNGLCFSPDYETLYLTDTSACDDHGGHHRITYASHGQASIFRYRVVNGTRVCGKSHFARISNGVPDGIKCDTRGNVYTGCGDGIYVFNPAGENIGRVVVGGGVANFCFGRGRVWVLSERRLMVSRIAAHGCLEELECE